MGSVQVYCASGIEFDYPLLLWW